MLADSFQLGYPSTWLHETMTSPPSPIILIVLIGLGLVLLSYLFDAIKPCRPFAPLCRFICLGIIVGCAAGLIGEFAYDFIERWLSRNLPIRSVARLIDVVFGFGYARYLGLLAGAAAAIWFWYTRPEQLPDTKGDWDL
jgi:hypothetical protein